MIVQKVLTVLFHCFHCIKNSFLPEKFVVFYENLLYHSQVENCDDVIHTQPQKKMGQRRKSELPLPNATVQALAKHLHPDDHLAAQNET